MHWQTFSKRSVDVKCALKRGSKSHIVLSFVPFRVFLFVITFKFFFCSTFIKDPYPFLLHIVFYNRIISRSRYDFVYHTSNFCSSFLNLCWSKFKTDIVDGKHSGTHLVSGTDWNVKKGKRSHYNLVIDEVFHNLHNYFLWNVTNLILERRDGRENFYYWDLWDTLGRVSQWVVTFYFYMCHNFFTDIFLYKLCKSIFQ